MSTKAKLLLALLAVAAFLFQGAAPGRAAQSGQRRDRPSPSEPTPTPTPTQTAPKKTTARPNAGPEKTDGRADTTTAKTQPAGAGGAAPTDPNAARFVYEFSKPDFFVYFIRIEHDETGRGQIRFERRSDVEQLTEPFQLSPTALERIGRRWSALEYLGSAASYQAPRDHSNLGQTRLTVRRGGRERTAEFNYSDVADAQALADEYRRAAEQAILVFELGIALEAQPLEMPKLINKLENLIKSNFLSDPQQLAPLLRQLAEDERVPLVGRNQVERILKKLEK